MDDPKPCPQRQAVPRHEGQWSIGLDLRLDRRVGPPSAHRQAKYDHPLSRLGLPRAACPLLTKPWIEGGQPDLEHPLESSHWGDLPGGGGTDAFYDQIAWFTKGTREALSFPFRSAGSVRWTDYLLTNLANVSRSWRISDHYPLWAEFGVRT